MQNMILANAVAFVYTSKVILMQGAHLYLRYALFNPTSNGKNNLLINSKSDLVFQLEGML